MSLSTLVSQRLFLSRTRALPYGLSGRSSLARCGPGRSHFAASFATSPGHAGPPLPRRGPIRRLGRVLKYLFGLSVLGVAGTGAYFTATDPTFPRRVGRAFKIYRGFASMFLDYKVVEYSDLYIRKEDEKVLEARYNELHEKYAPRVVALVLDLRGAWVKFAQVVASRPEFAPESYRKALKPLLDSVPPLPFSTIEETILGSLNVSDLSEIFASVDTDSLGAASVSQVHAAQLRDPASLVDRPGTEPRLVTDVVIKVRYPDAVENFSLDLRTMKQIVALARPQLLPAQQEVEKMIMRELDFNEESASLTEIGNAIRADPLGRFGNVVVPHPIPGLCTDSTIVMERLYGEKLADGVQRHYEIIAAGMGTTVDELKERVTGRFFGAFGRRPAAPKDGAAGDSKTSELPPLQDINWNSGISSYLSLLRAALTIVTPFELVSFAWSYVRVIWYESFGWWLGPTMWNGSVALFGLAERKELPLRPLPVNHASMFSDIAVVHGFEVLELGHFNGDPHPGNLWLTTDGRIGLLDYGATATLPRNQRLALARLVLLLNRSGEPDKPGIVREMKELGFSMSFAGDEAPEESAQREDDFLYRIATGLLTARGFGGRRHGQQGDRKSRPMFESVPDRFFLIARVVGLLRGLAFQLGLGNVDMAREWNRSAERALEMAAREEVGAQG
ncbi:hypothetical protein DFJ74DRAFT_644591 [Hyaloraphidium curvatum]|nr:hypothetical protein DFJ74DRAFT_644591 [Hyaloraphidium curvatum]